MEKKNRIKKKEKGRRNEMQKGCMSCKRGCEAVLSEGEEAVEVINKTMRDGDESDDDDDEVDRGQGGGEDQIFRV